MLRNKRMLINTIYKMPNVSGCYLVAKSHQDQQGSLSEKLRTLVTVQDGGPAISAHTCLTHSCFAMSLKSDNASKALYRSISAIFC